LYIRWITRKHKSTHASEMTFHDAYLVESYRDEKGMPRQRTISYLGNIREIAGEFPNVERELFLIRAKGILQNIEELSLEDYEHVLDHIHRHVPPLTQNEIIFAFQQNLRWFYEWCEKNNTHAPSADELHRLIESAKRQPEPF